MKYSIFGIVSTLIFIPAFVSLYFLFKQAGLGFETTNLFFCLLLIFSISGIVLAVFGLIQKNRKKLFSILGLVGNIIILSVPLIFYLLIWMIRLAETSG